MARKPQRKHMDWRDKPEKKPRTPNWAAEMKRAEQQLAKNKRLVLDGEMYAGQTRRRRSKNPGAHRDGLHS